MIMFLIYIYDEFFFFFISYTVGPYIGIKSDRATFLHTEFLSFFLFFYSLNILNKKNKFFFHSYSYSLLT